MLAKNIVHQVVLAGHSARFITASDLLLDLNGQETARALERRLRHYARPALLAIDEIGYLAYDAHAQGSGIEPGAGVCILRNASTGSICVFRRILNTDSGHREHGFRRL